MNEVQKSVQGTVLRNLRQNHPSLSHLDDDVILREYSVWNCGAEGTFEEWCEDIDPSSE